MAVQGALWLAKRLSFNLNFSFLNRISVLLRSSSYPIVLIRLGGPHSRRYTSRKNQGYSRESNPGPLGWQSDVLITMPNMRSQLKSTGPINAPIVSSAIERTFFKDNGSLKRSLNYRWKIGPINC